MFQTEFVTNPDKNTVKQIVSINRASFPAGWRPTDEENYYTQMLKDNQNISIFLTIEGKKIGYLHAIPHNTAVTELKDDDKLIKNTDSTYYIEIVSILPDYCGKNGFSALVQTLILELQKRNITQISLHARVSNNFSNKIQKKLKVTKIRRIENWKYYNEQEPTDYIEACW
ncbi:MAG: hypothetical protein A2252_02985 [Elusimicrobia bacterium RIFOXYA2_FULL_39_19]|nr:MAG: hypothetical protein A2252_02985 [Elusimicrobia bacterium RIFOXYA2_FULL_39_19]